MAEFNGAEALAYYNALLVEKDNAVAEAIANFAEQRIQEKLDAEQSRIEKEVIEEITLETSERYEREIGLLSKFVVIPEEVTEVEENEEVVE